MRELNAVRIEYGIDTCQKKAHLIAQFGAETNFSDLKESLYYTTEKALKSSYRFFRKKANKGKINDYLRNPEKLAKLVYYTENKSLGNKNEEDSCNNAFSSPPWMEIAISEAIALGFVHEEKSPANDMAKKYHTHVGKKNASGKTAWCSSFASWCLDQTEYKGSKSAASQSVLWQEGKLFKRIEEPVYGCIVLLTNYVVSNGRQTSNGHITFLAGKDSNGDLVCLGGNQGNTLKYSMYYSNKTKGRQFRQDQDEGKNTLVEQRLNGYFLPINYPEPSNKELKVLNTHKLNLNLGKPTNKPQSQNESTL